MKLNSIKKAVSAIALGLTLAVVAPCVAPVANTNVVSVEAATTTVGLNKKSTTLKVGQTETLKLTGVKGKVKWSTSKKKVATVKNGKVTAVSKGKAKITAKVGKKKYTCTVTVKANKLTEKTPSLSSVKKQSYGVTYSPVSYEYKNGKFIVTVKYYNTTTYQKVKKLGKTTATVSTVTLKPATYYPYYTEEKATVAKASFKAKSFNLGPNKVKNTTFTFSGSQIKKRLDLSQLRTQNYFYSYGNYGDTCLDINLDGKYTYSYR